jgi:hypothetical protein
MQSPFSIDWSSVFQPSVGVLEVVVRGSIMYLSLFAILRFIARRQSGRIGTADLLVIVLIADAAQNALGKDYQSVRFGSRLIEQGLAHELGGSARLEFLSEGLTGAIQFPMLLNEKDGR